MFYFERGRPTKAKKLNGASYSLGKCFNFGRGRPTTARENGYEREAVQRNFLKFVSQTIQRDLQKNHPRVLEKFYVGAKDRKYLPMAIEMEDVIR
jgi:hypothetical protein